MLDYLSKCFSSLPSSLLKVHLVNCFEKLTFLESDLFLICVLDLEIDFEIGVITFSDDLCSASGVTLKVMALKGANLALRFLAFFFDTLIGFMLS